MRALTLGIVSLSMIASPVLAQANAGPKGSQPSCSSSLVEKADGQGFELVRKCSDGVATKGLTRSMLPAREPIANGASLGSEELPLWLLLLGGAAAAVSLYFVVDGDGGNDAADDGDGVNPASPG